MLPTSLINKKSEYLLAIRIFLYLCNPLNHELSMQVPFIIIAALLPAALLWWYIWKQDSKKEPTSLLVKAVFFGVLICFPAALVEMGIGSMFFDMEKGPQTLFDTTATAFFCAAIPEEGLKLLVLWLILRRNPYFDEHFDGIVYAVSVGLGFAGIENLFYLIGNMDNWVGVALVRSLMSVPGHYAFAVLMGYYYSIYHFVDRSPRIAVCVIGAPVLAHGIYDALLMTTSVNVEVGAVCVMVLLYLLVKLHKYVQKRVVEQVERDRTSSI